MADREIGPGGEVRIPFDLDAYVERVRNGPCFVCEIVRGERVQPIVFRDDRHIAFLPDVHVLRGYVLVAPVEHRESVVGDFSEEEYLALQGLIRRVGRALSAVVPTERLYVLSLGSKDGNAHVHWHIAALPPGVPYDDQQYRALMSDSKGVLALPDGEQQELADALRLEIDHLDPLANGGSTSLENLDPDAGHTITPRPSTTAPPASSTAVRDGPDAAPNRR